MSNLVCDEWQAVQDTYQHGHDATYKRLQDRSHDASLDQAFGGRDQQGKVENVQDVAVVAHALLRREPNSHGWI